MREIKKDSSMLRLKISTRTLDETVTLVQMWLDNPRFSRLIITLNAVMWQKATEDRELSEILNSAQLITVDGFGVKQLLRHYGVSISEQVRGIDLLERLLQCCACSGYSVFFWGARPRISQRLQLRISQKFPQLRAFFLHGYTNVDEAIKKITVLKPNLVVAGLGCPKQEKALIRLLPQIPGAVGIGVGGALDVLSGQKRRAPQIFSRMGCEWLFRWLQDPRKIREAVQLLKFCRFFTGFSRKIKRNIFDYSIIFLGATLVGLGLSWILVPNRIASGGVSGLAVIAYHLWSWPVAQTIFFFNLPLFFLGIRFFGLSYGAKTIWGTVIVSLMTSFWTEFVRILPLTHDPLLASIYGGLCGGLGMGLVFRQQGTTGGTDLAARLLNRSSGLSIGTSLLIFDGFVVLMAGVAFGSPELSLYALISIAVSSKVLDWVVNGLNYAKAALIISDKDEMIGREILRQLKRGVTAWQGNGLYSGKERKVLLCVVARSEIMLLKETVKRCDTQAFVIIADVHEVLGEGFADYSEK